MRKDQGTERKKKKPIFSTIMKMRKLGIHTEKKCNLIPIS